MIRTTAWLAAFILLAALVLSIAKAIPLDSGKAERVVRITESNGGSVQGFVESYVRIRDSGARIIIDGPCASACTIFLGIMPPEKVCATPKAVLGFHTASLMPHPLLLVHSPIATSFVWSLYPERVKKLIRLGGWNGDDPTVEHRELVIINGLNGLFEIMNVCPVSDWN